MPYLLNTECFWITYVYTHRSKHARNHRRISKMTSPLEVWQGIGAADRGRVPQHGLHITLRMTPFYPGHYRLHWTPPGYCRLLHEYLRVFTDLTATFNAYRAGSGAVVYKQCGWDEANILDDFTSKTHDPMHYLFDVLLPPSNTLWNGAATKPLHHASPYWHTNAVECEYRSILRMYESQNRFGWRRIKIYRSTTRLGQIRYAFTTPFPQLVFALPLAGRQIRWMLAALAAPGMFGSENTRRFNTNIHGHYGCVQHQHRSVDHVHETMWGKLG